MVYGRLWFTWQYLYSWRPHIIESIISKQLKLYINKTIVSFFHAVNLYATQRSFASFKGQTYSSHDITMIIWFDIYTSIYRFVCVIVRFYFACLLSIQSLSCHLLRPYGECVLFCFETYLAGIKMVLKRSSVFICSCH